MAGLILSGIGKGLSDASDTFGKFMMADIADRRQTAREESALARQEKNLLASEARQDKQIEAAAERQAARDAALLDRQEAAAKAAQEKAEALENLRAANAATKAEKDIADRRTRAKEDLVEIGKRADEKEAGRDATQLDADTTRLAGLSSRVKGKSPSTDAETFKKLIKENPQYRDVYRQAGYIDGAGDPGQRALLRNDDESKAAIEIGADQNVINYYKDVRASVLRQIEIENKKVVADNKLPIEQQRADAATTRADAATTSANRPRTGRGDNTAKAPTPAQIATAERSLDNAIKLAESRFRPPNVLEKTNAAKMAQYEKEKADAIDKTPEVASRRRAVEELRGGSSRSTVGSAPYPDGTKLTGPDGKRYVVRNGKPVLER